MVEYFSNAYETTLNGAITDSDAQMTVTSDDGAPFSFPFRMRIIGDIPSETEIVTVTNVTGLVYDIDRATERYAGNQNTFNHANGAVVQHVLTADGLLGLFYDSVSLSISTVTDKVYTNFGTPDVSYEFLSSSFTGLTAMGSPDVEAAATTISNHYLVADNGSTWVGRYAAVTAPFTGIAKISTANLNANYMYAAIFCGVSTPGKMVTVGPRYNSGNNVAILTLATPGDGGAGQPSVFSNPSPPVQFPQYVAIQCVSNTDITYLWSSDGAIWYPILKNHNNSMTVGSVGIGVAAYAGPTVIAAFDYLRIWNSVLTLETVA